MKMLLWLVVLSSAAAVFGRPYQGGASYRILPRRAVMFGGYYSNPLFGRSYEFTPHGSMSAVVTRDAVATNTYAGGPLQYPPVDILSEQDKQPTEQFAEKEADVVHRQYIPPEAPKDTQSPVEAVTLPQPAQLEVADPQEEYLSPPAETPLANEVGLVEEVVTEAVATKAPRRVGKKKAIKPPPPKADEEEEEEDQEDAGLPAQWPFAGRKGSAPSYNAFFPISITGGAISRRRSQGGQGEGQGLEDYLPGSATAIANSFSTGKGGIATSHATSFGDPYLASLIRNGLLNFKSKKSHEA